VLAIGDLMDWSTDRIPHTSLVGAAWQDRSNVSAYDAFYEPGSASFYASLLTADGAQSRTRSLGIVIENIRLT
jgi:predicted nucleic acid-binding protein